MVALLNFDKTCLNYWQMIEKKRLDPFQNTFFYCFCGKNELGCFYEENFERISVIRVIFQNPCSNGNWTETYKILKEKDFSMNSWQWVKSDAHQHWYKQPSNTGTWYTSIIYHVYKTYFNFFFSFFLLLGLVIGKYLA